MIKIDLGEPELYNDWGTYNGYKDGEDHVTDEAGVHNIYQLLSSKALFDGYKSSKLAKRPVSLVRTGTSGIQRCTQTITCNNIEFKTVVFFGLEMYHPICLYLRITMVLKNTS